MIYLKVRQNKSGPVIGRHPWVFSGALENIPEKLKSGEPVKLFDPNGNFLAQGYFNSYSQIAVRIWSYDEKEEVNADFFRRRIENAFEIRKNYLDQMQTNAFRLINAENDFLPGLIVDQYADYLVVQFHTRGIEKWKNEIVSALQEKINPKGIFERSDTASRKKDENNTGLLAGEIPDQVIIKENGLKFYVDIKKGQKTGFFLDQRDKRLALQKYAKGKNVLNCFSYSGGFSVYALAAGAKKVTSVDVSESALELARENVKLNKLDLKKCEFVCADVKEYLRNAEPEKFDLIILDPPAFIKERKKKNQGISGYKKINESAMRVLAPAGILVSCSCSAHLSLNDFRYILSEAGGRTGRSLQLLETFTHSLDHLESVPFLESEYLKCCFIKVQ
ncbi:class I SAM-dependent rRNA methyltransferase [Patescibacteria group bacterium]|nr:class I SAM-dependent rRNA methyltransferase [Patescibacteria group bacterium]